MTTSRHRVQIKLIGGCAAIADWYDGKDEGDIAMDEAFLTYIHEHTRNAAIAKATQLAPHVIRWHCVSGY